MARHLRKVLLCLSLTALTCAAESEFKLPKPGFNLFSKAQDVQLGKEAAAQVEKQSRIVQDAKVNQYVDRIGQSLARLPEADPADFHYTFKVVYDKNINAFSLPGGPVFINTGLIAAADNEAQLAGVLAHEISHVALRHGTNQASKANLIQLPAALAGGLMGGGGSMLGQLAQIGIGLGANSVLLKFSRTAESQADALGAKMMSDAGYNPIEMARFFEKLEAQGGNGIQFLSDHPNPGNRVKAVEEEIQHFPHENYTTNTGQFDQIKATVAKLAPPPANAGAKAAKQVAEQARPSGQFRQFQGREFAINYPENWRTYGDSSSAMLTIAPPDAMQQTQQGSVSISYGVMISYYFPEGDQVNLERDTQQLIQQLKQSNPSMQTGASRHVRVGGSQALVTTLQSQNDTEIDSLVTVVRPQGLFYAVFVAPKSEWSKARGAFNQMLQSIRFSQ